MLITEITQPLNEYLAMSYPAWGWILPRGVIKMPTPAQAASGKPFIHQSLAKALGKRSLESAFASGWVRWLIDDHVLYLYTEKWTKGLEDTILKGTRNIEKILINPARIKQFAYYKEATIREYEFDMSTDEFLEISVTAKNANVLVKKMKRDAEDLGIIQS